MPAAGLQGRAHMTGAQRPRAGQHAGSRLQPGQQRTVLGHTRRGPGKADKRGTSSAEALAGQTSLGTPGSPEPREGAQRAEPSVRLQVSPEGKVSLLVSPQAASPASAARDTYARVHPHLLGDLACREAAVTQQHAQAAGIAAALEPCTEEAALGRAALMGRTAPCDEAVTCARGRLKRVPGGDPLQVSEPDLPCFILSLLGVPLGHQFMSCRPLDTSSGSSMSLLCPCVPNSCSPASVALL